MSQSYRTIQYSFTGGLLSPIQEGAVGATAYQQGLSIAENIFYGPGYGIVKRHGTQYEGNAYQSSIVFPYLFDGKIYGVEFGDKKARIITFSQFSDGGTASFGEDVATPYAIADVPELSVVSNQGALYIVHHLYKPRKMSLSGGELQAPAEISFVQALNPETPAEGDFKTTAITFDKIGDYPSLQLFYGGRWFLLATDNNPQMIWFSRSYDSDKGEYRFNDFTTSMKVYVNNGSGTMAWEDLGLADLAGIYLNSDMYGSNIRWVIAHQNFLLATGRSIYADAGNTTITSTADYPFSLSPALSYGSAGRQAYTLGSFVFFAGVDNRSVRCIAYNQSYDSYSGSDISAAVAQYLFNGIKKMCVTDGQMPILWVLSNDNDLLACYFESGQIIAWSRMVFDGDDYPEWIEAIQGGEDGYCALTLIMRRGEARTIENLEIVAPSSIWKYPCVDCWQKFSKGQTAKPLFQGRTTELMINYKEDSTGILKILAQDITNGEWEVGSVDNETDYAGIPFAMVAGTLRTELPANGTSQGAIRAVASVTLRLFNSVGGSIALRPDIDDSRYPYPKAIDLIESARPVLYRIYGDDLYGEAYKLYTGDKSTQFSTAVLDDDRVVIVASDPFPFCICAIIIKHSITEA